jgi:15-cis-phytoene synthase
MSFPAQSYAYCDRLARREAANFYHAFRLLPRPQRLAMCALYSFLRVTDDIADAEDEVALKQDRLDDWRLRHERMLTGQYSHPLHPAFHHTITTYRIPHEYLTAALDGVTMDMSIARYPTFADLHLYCYRVAGVVGLSCIHIWGFRDATALEYAEAAGIAFQLTNILRDLAEDVGKGRIYLPTEDLDRFGYTADDLRQHRRGKNFEELMRFQVERARHYYETAEALVPLLLGPGRAVFLVMLRTYRGILEKIERTQYDVFSGRVRLSRWRKLWLVLQALPVRWGLRQGV